MRLTAEAYEILNWLRDKYIEAEYPNHRVWTFSPAESNRRAFAELAANGIIETIGAGREKWTLTDLGQSLVMQLDEVAKKLDDTASPEQPMPRVAEVGEPAEHRAQLYDALGLDEAMTDPCRALFIDVVQVNATHDGHHGHKHGWRPAIEWASPQRGSPTPRVLYELLSVADGSTTRDARSSVSPEPTAHLGMCFAPSPTRPPRAPSISTRPSPGKSGARPWPSSTSSDRPPRS
jgi:hypothetical protein